MLLSEVDELVSLVHSQYAACKFKPSNDYQYTVLAAFVLEAPNYHTDSETAKLTSVLDSQDDTCSGDKHARRMKVISMATGSKCLPTSRYPLRGDALHDSHAEVLARRGVIRWLHEEVQRAVHSSSASEWLALQQNGKWALKMHVKMHMYVSTVPCGDASMRFLAATQDAAMAALKDSAPPVAPAPGSASRGRNNYTLYGVLRTKPGRADSPPTLCMSCSDKIASWNVLGLQGALGARIFSAIYLDSMIIGDVPFEMQSVVKDDCERAFYGRLKGVTGLPEGFRLVEPEIHFTPSIFVHSRTALQAARPDKLPPPSSNESLSWFADSPAGHEVIINGTRRGIGAKHRELEKFRPRLCKLQLFRLHVETRGSLVCAVSSSDASYHHAKNEVQDYQDARLALKGANGPFAGWVVSGKAWESFDLEGNITITPSDEAVVGTPT